MVNMPGSNAINNTWLRLEPMGKRNLFVYPRIERIERFVEPLL
jgi:hypothetical protein